MTSAKDDYEARKRFMGWFPERYMNINPDAPDHPLKVLARFEATAPSKARKGLDMAINDCVEMAEGFRPDQMRAADEELAGMGLPTLSALRLKRNRHLKAVLKRGSIRTEVEYYALKDMADSAIHEDERAQLWRLLEEFEERARPAPVRST
ncbi:hypothetical protein KXR53_01495 [Inquilinus limosus]|uniref:hypothetical protein n=1 Tax=Inquilinus limosus TaxID=171674 RepID=UPI003F157ACA